MEMVGTEDMAAQTGGLGRMRKLFINFKKNPLGFQEEAEAQEGTAQTPENPMAQREQIIPMMLQLLALAAGAGVANNLHGP